MKKRVTSKEIAIKTRYSINTVSRALKNVVNLYII